MKIKPEVYLKFFEILEQKFIETEFDPKEVPQDSREIWDKRLPSLKGSKIRYVAVERFDLRDNPYYFFRKYREDRHLPLIPVRDSSFQLALLYLGTLPVQSIPKSISDAEKLRYLYTYFLIQYLPHYDPTGDANIILELYNRHRIEPAADPSSSDHIEFSEVKNLVSSFYNNIAINDLSSAWNCLSTTFQNREVWLGNYERFAGGYVTTRGIRHVAVFNVKRINSAMIDCKVFYEDEMAIYPVKGLAGLEDLTVSDIDEFVRRVDMVKNDIQQKGGTNFDRIPLAKFFNPAAIEYIWYECGIPADSLQQLFPKPKAVIVWRLYDCSCIIENGKWRINNISPAQIYSIR